MDDVVLSKAFEAFKSAYINLVDVIESQNAEEKISKNYPFDKSFDELDVIKWCNTYITSIEVGDEIKSTLRSKKAIVIYISDDNTLFCLDEDGMFITVGSSIRHLWRKTGNQFPMRAFYRFMEEK